MAWERNFEAKVLKVREKELKFQKLNYTIEVCLSAQHSERGITKSAIGSMECYLVNWIFLSLPCSYF